MLPPVVIATAGHIDHGKTALVKALTGIDTDRLKEEKERSITIDLGFAYLDDRISIIDVPGHERFIKNMAAGVGAVDLALLVVAADDGVMPQTREHHDILCLIGVQRAIVVITKIDLAGEEWLQMVEEDIRSLLDGGPFADAPVLRVSSTTQEGIAQLKQMIVDIAGQPIWRRDSGFFRMPIDRSFLMHGFGTVVTGTVVSGRISIGSTVQLLPQVRDVRVRGLQVHGNPVETAVAGDRVAINLAGVEKQDVDRGDVLADPGYLRPSVLFDARVTSLGHAPAPIRNRSRIRIHLGTKEHLARVLLLDCDELPPGASELAQVRLEGVGVAVKGDRFVIRRYSPTITIAGGIILDPNPHRHRRRDKDTLSLLTALEDGRLHDIVVARLKASANRSRTAQELASETGAHLEAVLDQLQHLPPDSDVLLFGSHPQWRAFHRDHWTRLRDRVASAIGEFHRANPLKPGVNRDELRSKGFRPTEPALFEDVLKALASDGVIVSRGPLYALAAHAITLSPPQQRLRESISLILREEGLSASRLQVIALRLGERLADVQSIAEAMIKLGDVVRIDEQIILHAEAVRHTQEKLVDWLRGKQSITVSEFKELVGTSRKYAVPLLVYFDSIGVTLRQGDTRILGRPV